MSGAVNNIGISSNAVLESGGWKYGANGYANFMAVGNGGGQYAWYTAPSGTAGNAISFTQDMTLTSTGLGIGTSSPTSKLDVVSASTGVAEFEGPANATVVFRGSGFVEGKIQCGGEFNFGSTNNFPVGFLTNNIERARITSDGSLLVGTAASGGQSGFAVLKGGSGIETSIEIAHNFGTASGIKYVDFLYATGSIGSITQSGTTAVLYNVTSDQRLKENIVDAPEFGSVIDSIQVRSFDWKTDQTHQRAGFIAQELVTVAPEAVHQPADPEEMMAVDYSKLVPMLVKEIQSLRARLAAANI